MPTRNVSLTEHQDNFVAEIVASGRYQNASEVVREGLRRLERDEAEWQAKHARLVQALDGWVEENQRGEYLELAPDEVGPWLDSLDETPREAAA